MNTIPVPRSGCSMIRSHGTPTTSAGFHSSTSDFGASRFAASTLASISTTVIFASSDGCPIRTPPSASQLFVPAAVPEPLPKKSSMNNTRIVPTYAGTVTQSNSRTDARLTANAPISPSVNQRICWRYRWATAVGTSVWPAEYTIAMPYADSSSATAASGPSSLMRRVGGHPPVSTRVVTVVLR